MASLTDTIEAGMAQSHGLLEHALLGTTDPATIANHVEEWTAQHLNASVAAGIAYASSVGVLVGIELVDGRRVAIKIHRPDAGNRLGAVREIQARLASGGFPAPMPIAEPAQLRAGVAAAETWLDAAERPDGHDDRDRALLVTALHDLIERTRPSAASTTLPPPWPLRDTTDLWPPPHDLRFDFDATAEGAEWIDDIGRAARAALVEVATHNPDGDGWVVGHHDWRAEHVRLDRDHTRVVAVYDWDSLQRTTEAACVGEAAWALPADWSVGQPRPFCDAGEIDDFIARYAEARGRPFTKDERNIAGAVATYSLAYTARCVHSDRQLGAVAHGAWADALPDLLRAVAQRWSIGT